MRKILTSIVLASMLVSAWIATPGNIRSAEIMQSIRCDEERSGLRFGQRDYWGCDE